VIWEYSNTYEGETISVKLKAEEVDNYITWEMLWNYEGSEGPNYSEFPVLQGRTGLD
jgi:hypothetical protein